MSTPPAPAPAAVTVALESRLQSSQLSLSPSRLPIFHARTTLPFVGPYRRTVPEAVPVPTQQDRFVQHEETNPRGHPSAAGDRDEEMKQNP